MRWRSRTPRGSSSEYLGLVRGSFSSFSTSSDDEYRLLRQNLFERFSSNATVPTEASVVPVARPRSRTQEGRSEWFYNNVQSFIAEH